MHLLLVDGSGYIFRAFHALPPLNRKSDGLPVGCVQGFCNMLWKLMEDLKGEDEPTHMAVIFDAKGKTFRDDFFPDYKAQRPPAPEELVPQFPLTRSATRAFNIPSIEMEGWEADDIIATYACNARAAGGKVTIVSSDKDLMQLVEPDGSIRLLDTIPRPGQPPLRWIGVDEVFNKFGVTPDKVIDVQALCGDSVDNVPGVPGIGIKTAAELINTYGDLETLLARASEIKQNARREKLIANAELARISKRLVTLEQKVPVALDLDALARQPIEPGKLFPFLKAMEFATITKRLAGLIGADPDAWEPDPELAVKQASPIGFNNEARAEARAARAEAAGKAEAPLVLHAAAEHERIKSIPWTPEAYEIIRDAEGLQRWIDAIYRTGHVATDTETTGLDNQTADLVGLSFSIRPGTGAYLPLGHASGEGDMFGTGKAEGQMDIRLALDILRPLFADRSILKIFHNAKYDLGLLARYDIAVNSIDDTLLLSYALDGPQYNTMAELADHWLGVPGTSIKELIGSGKGQITFAQVEIDKAARYAAEDSDMTIRLWQVLKPRLAAENMTTVYETLERPLAPVLGRMEGRGIHVDRQILARLSGDFAQRAAALEAEAYELAGSSFNLGSPKQLGEILFDRMGLEGGTKTKTGAWSTGADVLEDLALKGVPLARTIVDWRQLTKLMGTYTDALPNYINQRTGRVHTTYSQHSVLTGRLSSNDPNLQNIPVRTSDGRKIRTAFVAAPGKILISADYSQIELRVLAHIADIQALKDAFEEGLDIHAMTASEMFGVPVEGMPSDVRRRAKAINFGIIYGISAFGLANQLAIPRGEAGDYIKTYFERFPGIKDYMDSQRRRVKEDGFVTTIFGRKINFPNANSSHAAERSFVERASINAPIQGSAADIIRRAMIRMEPELKKAGVEADMLLQVHDELIFEVPLGTEEGAMTAIKRVMEGAAEPAVRLSVPIQVDAHAAHNWDEAH
ncbi:MAG: DNA polymerase I [Alphaproteobacteria bacterium]|nr:DNA polymerase I [Alphaproteobacteria bacterium]MBU1562590.1 DNA polymerase I [Alphaproteobacteria bacterium]MBU2303232.1 DNA polymerase I [Alphaproteobacteria bacterium]MBU2370367.1 DNA polymerase I [Alphaproteobacteria bacterium]